MAQGDLIRYNDLSSLRNTVNTILNGSSESGGLNQGHSISGNPSVGSVIDDAYQDSIFSGVAKLTNHYNISNPLTGVNAGTIVDWDQYAAPAAALINTLNDKHNNPQSSANRGTYDTSLATVDSSAVSNWNGTKTFQFTVTFANQATKWAWFNAGGEIRIGASHNSTVDPQAQSWNSLTNTFSSGGFAVYKDGTDSTSNATYKNSHEVSNIPASWATLKTVYSTDSYYTLNYIKVDGYQTANVMHYRVTIADAHTGSYSGVGSDIVSGTTTCNVELLNMTNPSGGVNISNPSVATTSNF